MQQADQTVNDTVQAAVEAFAPLEKAGRAGRAQLLDSIASALEGEQADIVASADRETHLGTTRLEGELARTCFQLRLFGEVLRDGGYAEATIDSTGTTPAGPRPDLRRMLVPVGPVAVFGASNFPLAFSVPGGDTASALAAGCPVVAKAHPAHPETSRLTHAIISRAVTEAGLPAGTIGLVEGFAAGPALVTHPAIRAAGFTGSLAGGRALFDLAAARPEPIPFYGELSSLNPLVVTPGAAAERGRQVADDYLASVTLGSGQFCTKPGVLLAPAGAVEFHAALADAVAAATAGTMLTSAIRDTVAAAAGHRDHDSRLRPIGRGTTATDDAVAPALYAVAAGDLDDDLLEETFGPMALVVEYADEDDLLSTLRRLPGQLTATMHAQPAEETLVARLHEVVRGTAGRLVFDGYPTGVAVAWAMHHGGGYPATTSLHTSVGPTSIRRWLRPISYQNAPEFVLPSELRDGNPDAIPRRVDGVLQG